MAVLEVLHLWAGLEVLFEGVAALAWREAEGSLVD